MTTFVLVITNRCGAILAAIDTYMIIDNRLQPLLTSARFLPTSAPSREIVSGERRSFFFSRRLHTHIYIHAHTYTTLNYRRIPRLPHLVRGNRFLKLTPRRNFRLVEFRLQKGSWINAKFGLSRGLHSPPSFFLPPFSSPILVVFVGPTFFSAPFSLARRVWEFSWIHFSETPRPENPTFLHGRALSFPGRTLISARSSVKKIGARAFPRGYACDLRVAFHESREEKRIKLDRDTPLFLYGMLEKTRPERNVRANVLEKYLSEKENRIVKCCSVIYHIKFKPE